MAPLHLLLIRFSSLGDIVLHSSCAAAIKRRWGQSVHISLLTSQVFAPLMEETPFIDEIHSFSRTQGLRELVKQVKGIHEKRKIDFLLDIHGSLRSLLIRYYFWQIPRLYGDKRTLERFLLTWGKLDILSPQYAHAYGEGRGEKNGFGELLLKRIPRDFASVFQYSTTSWGPKAQLSFSSWTFQHDNIPLELGVESPFILVAPSASFVEKRWPAEYFKKFLQMALEDVELAPFQFVITAGPEDSFCLAFEDLCKLYPQRLLNLQGKTTLDESVQLAKAAHFCIGNDTGIIHYAESVGTPVLAILGPTGEQFGFYPHLPGSDTVSLSLWCRPCSSNGKGRCVRSERFCLTLISPKIVLNKVKKLLPRNLLGEAV